MADDPFAEFAGQRFGVVVCDPPWHFATRSPKGWAKSPQKHYRTMTLEEMCALPVASLGADDCALVMWATAPHLPQAFTVMSAWGWTFKTAGCWAKQSRAGRHWQFGTGYLLRSAAEFFLIGTRGKPKTVSRSVRNLIVAPVGRHSEKPFAMHGICEQLWPSAQKIELFARARVPGWYSWGLEVDGPQETEQEKARREAEGPGARCEGDAAVLDGAPGA